MVPTERVVTQFFILILCIINGLHSYPRQRPSLGILNELIDQDSKSPLIVVVDSNNQARTLDDDQDLRQEQRKGRHVHNPVHHSDNFSEREYENALYELLRTSERMLDEQYARSRSSDKKKNGKKNGNGKKKDSGKKNGKDKKNGLGKKNGKKNDKKDDTCDGSEESQDTCKKNGKKKDSCEATKESKTEFLAEQCSKSERSCDDSQTC